MDMEILVLAVIDLIHHQAVLDFVQIIQLFTQTQILLHTLVLRQGKIL
jgi:hypothetical protein